MRQESLQLEEQNFQLQLKTELHQLYRSVELASARVDDMRQQLSLIQQEALLQDALGAGQISLIEYLIELQFNYDAIDQLTEAERALQLNWVKLKVLGM